MARTVKYYPSRVKDELRRFGRAYVQKKYGMAVYAKVTGQTMKQAAKSIKGTKGQVLDYVGNRVDRNGKGRIYADGEEDHTLHSHRIGADKHKAGVGGIGNRGGKDNPLAPAGSQRNKMAPHRSAGSAKNAPPTARDGWKGPGILNAFVEGGMAELAAGPDAFKRQMNFNLSNDEDLAQGQEHQWAQATSISSLISGQLRMAANQPVDAWEQWAQDKTGQTTITNRNGGAFGIDVQYNPDYAESQSAATKMAQTNPMGAFGTSSVMYDLGEEPEAMVEESIDGDNVTAAGTFAGWKANELGDLGFQDSKDYNDWATKDKASFDRGYKNAVEAFLRNGGRQGGQKAVDARNAALQQEFVAYWNKHTTGGKMQYNAGTNSTGWVDDKPAGGTAPPLTPQSTIPKTYQPGEADDALRDSEFRPTSGVYNPWSYGEGGEYNMMGPSAQTMGQATMEAMSLANAYFAPQRAELAYELGDMETDMRRLAVNLGRQVDDPVLQAKLYKEASRATRTLDIQQNTFAFQMADARRKEELQNWQFYDQMAQQEHQLRLANKQFYKTLDLQYSQYNLANWAAQAQANAGLPGQTSPPTGAAESEDGSTYGSAKSVAPTIDSPLYKRSY